jgi:DNA-binding transcriptional LysR family regulator
MDSLGALSAFVQAADANGFTEAGRKLGVSPSAISKAVQRLEERLGARLFHRSTRSITLTPEGAVFLERCRRILCEVESAEAELTQTQSAPQGKLRVSLPSIGVLFMPRFAEFKRLHPQIEMEMDFSDRLVDVIDEGFDAVIRTGEQTDSRLMARKLGSFRKIIVGSPAYFKQAGLPTRPEDLADHACLIYRYPSTGKLDRWPLQRDEQAVEVALPTSMVMNTLDPQICLAELGLGLACVPDMAVRRQLETGSLVSVLDDDMQARTTMRVLWPSSRHLSSKVRAFVDFAADKLLVTS